MNKTDKNNEISIEQFIRIIENLPDHEYKNKWLRWLREYETSNRFGRNSNVKRSAKFVYNNLAYPEMLLWLIQAAGIDGEDVKLAESESANITNVRSQSAVIRKIVPWKNLKQMLWVK